MHFFVNNPYEYRRYLKITKKPFPAFFWKELHSKKTPESHMQESHMQESRKKTAEERRKDLTAVFCKRIFARAETPVVE